ncbi:hypothetical protein IE53DRAFT_367073 [Violaceomyces palustris]|uniref:Uncharacterized protein n=1 Tax=Violaceomyces palustris TaxID=1673888 RepID=A0ACD0P3D4_9BASI|nr:hypothetical protein IE53DRAFT_367073 [Violaceomyces palustris]
MIPQPLPIAYLAPPPLSLLPIEKPHKDELYAFHQDATSCPELVSADSSDESTDSEDSRRDSSASLGLSPVLHPTTAFDQRQDAFGPPSSANRQTFGLKILRKPSGWSLTSPKLGCPKSPRQRPTDAIIYPSACKVSGSFACSPLLESFPEGDLIPPSPVSPSKPVVSNLSYQPLEPPSRLVALSKCEVEPSPLSSPATIYLPSTPVTPVSPTSPLVKFERPPDPTVKDGVGVLSFGQQSIENSPAFLRSNLRRRSSWFSASFRRKRRDSSPNLLPVEAGTGLGLITTPASAPQEGDESIHVSNMNPLPLPPDLVKAKETIETLGWGWGSAAERVWGPSRRDSINKPIVSDTEDSESSPKNAMVKYRSLEKAVIKSSDPSVARWNKFIPAYTNGDLDINDIPAPPPKGVPDPFLSPDATPLNPGIFLAPSPEFEKERQLALDRLELDQMDEKGKTKIRDIVDYCREYLGTAFAFFTVVDGEKTRFFCISPKDTTSGDLPREKTLCGHTILNRNDGFVVLNIKSDWRFAQACHLEAYDFYAAVPVTSSDGLPIATLCAVDTQPWNCFTDKQRIKMRELATQIGSEIEKSFARNFKEKLDRMEASWLKMEERLSKRPEIPAGTAIGPRFPPSLKDQRRSSVKHPLPIMELCAVEMQQNLSIDMRSISALGITMTRCDVGHLNFSAGLIADTLGMETVYYVAVDSITKSCVLLANHGMPHPTPKVEVALHRRALDSAEEGLVYQNAEKGELVSEGDSGLPVFGEGEGRQQYRVGILCPVEFESADVEKTSGLSLSAETAHPPPNENAAPGNTRYIPTKKSASIGFVLVAMTTNPKRVVGIEDLRYLQGFSTIIRALLKRFIASESIEEIEEIPADELRDLEKSPAAAQRDNIKRRAVKGVKGSLKAGSDGLHHISRLPGRAIDVVSEANSSLQKGIALQFHRVHSSIDPFKADSSHEKHKSKHALNPAEKLSLTETESSDRPSRTSSFLASSFRRSSISRADSNLSGRKEASPLPFEPMGAMPGDGLRPPPLTLRREKSTTISEADPNVSTQIVAPLPIKPWEKGGSGKVITVPAPASPSTFSSGKGNSKYLEIDVRKASYCDYGRSSSPPEMSPRFESKLSPFRASTPSEAASLEKNGATPLHTLSSTPKPTLASRRPSLATTRTWSDKERPPLLTRHSQPGRRPSERGEKLVALLNVPKIGPV